MEDRGTASVLHFLFKMEVGMSARTGGSRSTHETITQSPRMGGLADARPPAVDRPNFGRRSSLAAIRSFAGLTAVFSSHSHLVDHHWHTAPDSSATIAGSYVARR